MQLITSTYKTNLLKLSGFCTYQQDKHAEILTSPHTLCLRICIDLRTKSDNFFVFSLQHQLFDFSSRDEMCLLRGTDWMFNCNIR